MKYKARRAVGKKQAPWRASRWRDWEVKSFFKSVFRRDIELWMYSPFGGPSKPGLGRELHVDTIV